MIGQSTTGEPRLIQPPRCFPCSMCCSTHEKQVFISHAGSDKNLARDIANAGCKIGVASYLFEYAPNPDGQSTPAESIAEEIVNSDAVFVLLSDAVSEAYWTQSWIGFEIGLARGSDIARAPKDHGSYLAKSYFYRKIIVLQDIRQGIKASIPWLDVLVLFDFTDEKGWEQYRNLLWVIALKDAPLEFFQRGNQFRSRFMVASIKCNNGKCRSEYEAWIAIRDARKIRGIYRAITGQPVIHAEYTLECPSCDERITSCFRQGLPTYSKWQWLAKGLQWARRHLRRRDS